MMGRTDAPIYLLCSDKTKKENLWYVIENSYEQKEYIMANKDNMKLTDEGWIKTIHESESDRIRAFRLPAFSQHCVYEGCLAVSDSHIYVMDDKHKLIFYDYSSFNNKTWEEGPCFTYGSFILLNNGSIYEWPGRGNKTSSPGLLLEPKPHFYCSEWRKFPKIQLNETKYVGFEFGELLACTDTKIYRIFHVDLNEIPWGIYFDIQTRECEIFDKSFRGRWGQGVILYDSYLFLCGKPDYHDDDKSLFVYDLKQRQWLPHYVPFFDKFEEFLPNCSDKCGNCCLNLLQVCNNKFAVVWEYRKQPHWYKKEAKNEAKICWTKFIIHKDFSSSSDNPFRAELYSHGVCDVMGSLLSIAAEQRLNHPQFSAIPKLNGINHKSWVEFLKRNLAQMEIDLALRKDPPPKPADEATVVEKNFYREWKYSNRICLKIISYHMEDSIRDSIPKTGCAKSFLKAINKKYRHLTRNEKNELLSTLHSFIYDGKSGIREHIDKVVACYRKMKEIGLKLDDDYIVWMIMHNLPSQFDSIRSRYNAQKEQWPLEEMTTILVKEEVDMYMVMARKRWLG